MRLRGLLRLRGRARRRARPLCVEGPVLGVSVLLLNASGCLDALTAPEVAAFARRVRHEDGDARAARREPAGPHRRGRGWDAERDRAREPGPRGVPGADAAAPGRARRADLGLRRRLLGPRLRRHLRAARPRPRRGLELNLSCPNVDEAPESAAEIVAACRAATGLPLFAKLSPAAWDIAEVARAVEAAGADGLSLVNTIRGLALDRRLQPRLARATGGYSGPALKPIALAAVYACRRATALPIVGMGGVGSGRDVLELVACGATHVALGTALFADPEAPGRVRRSSPTSSRQPVSTGSRDAFCAAHDALSRSANEP